MWQLLASALFQHELERQAADRERQIEEQRARAQREAEAKAIQMQAMMEREAAERAMIGRHPVPQLSGLMAEMYLPESSSILSGPASHTVQAGETLGRIAARYGTTVAQLFALNRGRTVNVGGVTRTLSSPDLIWPGLVLQLPSGASDVPPAAPVAPQVPVADPSQPQPVKQSGNLLIWGVLIAGGLFIAADQKWI